MALATALEMGSEIPVIRREPLISLRLMDLTSEYAPH